MINSEYDTSVKYTQWTKSAIECYLRGCICRNCSVYNAIGKRCKMKKAVLYLVRKYGMPKGKDYEELKNRRIYNSKNIQGLVR